MWSYQVIMSSMSRDQKLGSTLSLGVTHRPLGENSCRLQRSNTGKDVAHLVNAILMATKPKGCARNLCSVVGSLSSLCLIMVHSLLPSSLQSLRLSMAPDTFKQLCTTLPAMVQLSSYLKQSKRELEEDLTVHQALQAWCFDSPQWHLLATTCVSPSIFIFGHTTCFRHDETRGIGPQEAWVTEKLGPPSYYSEVCKYGMLEEAHWPLEDPRTR